MLSTDNMSNHSDLYIPAEYLDDLCSRFIINLPPEESKNLIRICFHIEQAHWFFLDYYCTDRNTGLKPCGIRKFTAHIFQHVPYLRKHSNNIDTILDNWREYKQLVPSYGVILLDTELTHVLLVQPFSTKSWGFPKGKVNQGEEPWMCAVREVQEETGFDISQLINKDDYMESVIHGQIVRLYIIDNIPRNTKFEPRTRREIRSCVWFPLDDLPANKTDMISRADSGLNPNTYYMVAQFVKRIRQWVYVRNRNMVTNTRRTRHKSVGNIGSGTQRIETTSREWQNEIWEYQQQRYNFQKQFRSHENRHQNTYVNNRGNSPGDGYFNHHDNSPWNSHSNSPGDGYFNHHDYSHGYNDNISHWNYHSNGNYDHHNNNRRYNTHDNSSFRNQNHQNVRRNSRTNNYSPGHFNNHSHGHGHSHNNNHAYYGNSRWDNYGNSRWDNYGNSRWDNFGNSPWDNHRNSPFNNQNYSHRHTHGNSHQGNSPFNNHSNGHRNHHGNSHGNDRDNDQYSMGILTTNDSSIMTDKNMTELQLFTPQDSDDNGFSAMQIDLNPGSSTIDIMPTDTERIENGFLKFLAPSWRNFKLDNQAILCCLT